MKPKHWVTCSKGCRAPQFCGSQDIALLTSSRMHPPYPTISGDARVREVGRLTRRRMSTLISRFLRQFHKIDYAIYNFKLFAYLGCCSLPAAVISELSLIGKALTLYFPPPVASPSKSEGAFADPDRLADQLLFG